MFKVVYQGLKRIISVLDKLLRLCNSQFRVFIYTAKEDENARGFQIIIIDRKKE